MPTIDHNNDIYIHCYVVHDANTSHGLYPQLHLLNFNHPLCSLGEAEKHAYYHRGKPYSNFGNSEFKLSGNKEKTKKTPPFMAIAVTTPCL